MPLSSMISESESEFPIISNKHAVKVYAKCPGGSRVIRLPGGYNLVLTVLINCEDSVRLSGLCKGPLNVW
jgi:hypothetical protein